jgi:hypothetical protein
VGNWEGWTRIADDEYERHVPSGKWYACGSWLYKFSGHDGSSIEQLLNGQYFEEWEYFAKRSYPSTASRSARLWSALELAARFAEFAGQAALDKLIERAKPGTYKAELELARETLARFR